VKRSLQLIEIREMAGYARANRAHWWSTFFATSSDFFRHEFGRL
jgi:hypothetical protein